MGKITVYILMMTGILMLFYFAGLGLEQDCTNPTIGDTLFCILIEPEKLPDSTNVFMVKVAAGMALAIGAGIAIGFGLAGNLDVAILSFVAIPLLSLMWQFINVFNVVKRANPVIAILFFAPILFYFAILIIEWITGRDN